MADRDQSCFELDLTKVPTRVWCGGGGGGGGGQWRAIPGHNEDPGV